MAKRNSKSDKKKEATSKVSYHYKPDNLTLQEWQIALLCLTSYWLPKNKMTTKEIRFTDMCLIP